ncbi:MAG: DUF1080 domain-containing protein [Planctomycetes bacterium]|nr:DUF1080 domain-containing protein [Planctomycetota bacterium]
MVVAAALLLVVVAVVVMMNPSAGDTGEGRIETFVNAAHRGPGASVAPGRTGPLRQQPGDDVPEDHRYTSSPPPSVAVPDSPVSTASPAPPVMPPDIPAGPAAPQPPAVPAAPAAPAAPAKNDTARLRRLYRSARDRYSQHLRAREYAGAGRIARELAADAGFADVAHLLEADGRDMDLLETFLDRVAANMKTLVGSNIRTLGSSAKLVKVEGRNTTFRIRGAEMTQSIVKLSPEQLMEFYGIAPGADEAEQAAVRAAFWLAENKLKDAGWMLGQVMLASDLRSVLGQRLKLLGDAPVDEPAPADEPASAQVPDTPAGPEAPPDAPAAAPPPPEPGWQPIFDGRTMAGWRRCSSGSVVFENSAMVLADAIDMLYPADWENFVLECEVSAVGSSSGGTRLSMSFGQTQLGRNSGRFDFYSYTDGDIHFNRHGKRFFQAGGGKLFIDGWVPLRFEVSRERCKVFVRGTLAADVDLSQVPAEPGGIALRAHGTASSVSFRNMRVKILPR